MSPPFPIPEGQLEDLRLLCTLDVETLDSIVSRLSEIDKVLLTTIQLTREIEATTGITDDVATAIIRPALVCSRLVRNRVIDIDQILEGLGAGIDRSNWQPGDKAKWKVLSCAFGRLVQSKPVMTVSKSYELSYDYANLFQGVRIVADVRPIFNDEQSSPELEIDGAVISYTLRLHFDDHIGSHSLSICMDDGDLEELLFQCERAKEKGEVALRRMSEAKIKTIISGRSSDAS